MTDETRAERKARQAANRATTAGMTSMQRIEYYTGDVRFQALRVRVQKKTGTVAALIGKRPLGALEGARAEITDGGRPFDIASAVAGAALAGPVGLTAGLRARQATAFVIFADGTYHEHKLRNYAEIIKAQAEVVRFNALVGVRRKFSEPEHR